MKNLNDFKMFLNTAKVTNIPVKFINKISQKISYQFITKVHSDSFDTIDLKSKETFTYLIALEDMIVFEEFKVHYKDINRNNIFFHYIFYLIKIVNPEYLFSTLF